MWFYICLLFLYMILHACTCPLHEFTIVPMFFTFVVDIIWTYFGRRNHLDIIWTSFGYHLDIIWTSFGHHLEIIWTSFGHYLDIICGSFRDDLGISRRWFTNCLGIIWGSCSKKLRGGVQRAKPPRKARRFVGPQGPPTLHNRTWMIFRQ